MPQLNPKGTHLVNHLHFILRLWIQFTLEKVSWKAPNLKNLFFRPVVTSQQGEIGQVEDELENAKQTSFGYGGWVGMWTTEVSFPEELSEIFNNSAEVGTRVNIAGMRSPTERKMMARFEKYLLAKLGNKSSERYNHISFACRHLFTQTSSRWCDSPRYSINE